MTKKTAPAAAADLSATEVVGVTPEMMNLEVEKLTNLVNDLTARVSELETKLEAKAGPKSERAMTDDDARKILAFGDLEAASHKEAAEKLGLSYGQIYSCRKGFTFKEIHKEIEKKIEAEKSEA